MEVVGLVVGVVSLLPVVIDGWAKACELFQSAQKFTKDIRKTEEKLAVQRRLFEREFHLLLRAVVDPALASAMMADPHHPEWKSRNFRNRWEKIMGDVFDLPIKIILDTLQNIQRTLAKLQEQASGQVDEKGVPITSKASRRKIARIWTKRVDWIMTSKNKLQQEIAVLRQQTNDLRTFREQRAVFEQPLARTASTASVLSTESRAPSQQMLRMREDSKKLLAELQSTAVCSCHQVNFRLASPLDVEELENERYEGEAVSFRFMVTRGQECTCLTIQPAAPTSRREDSTSKDRKPMKTSSGRGKIKFVLEDDEEEPFDPPPPSYPGHESAQAIEDLCSLLSNLPPGSLSPNNCLGSLQKRNHYLLYSGPSTPAIPPMRLSLAELLERPDKQLILPIEERLKIALTLSLSLLQFGSYSTSWFQERWRSRDVFFFLDANGRLLDTSLEESDPDPVENEEEMQPYVVPFRPAKTPPPKQPQGLARNEQMYSLALVLIEIALGERLFTVPPNANPTTAETDEFAEYLKAKRILTSRMLGKNMGSVFAEVVKRCFFCDFGGGDSMEDDFTKRELQDMFFDRVVRRLGECWRGWRGQALA